MRVLWITPGFAANEHDLNCIPPLYLLAEELSRIGVDLHILTIAYPFTSQPYKWNGIPVVPGYGFNGRWFRWLNHQRVLKNAKIANQIKKFDVIHSFWFGPAWLIGQRLHKLWGIPHYTTLMGQDALTENWYLRFFKSVHAKSLIAISEVHNDIFAKSTGTRAAHSIPWGVRDQEIPTQLAGTRTVDVLGCGSLIPLKNWQLWLDVVEGLVKYNPELKAELIGDGPERKNIEELIQQKGLQKNVFLSGNLPRPQVLARMRDSKVLLHTSNYESFGYVLAEAAMNGCRIVSTPVGIAPQLTDYIAQGDVLIEQTKKVLELPIKSTPFVPFLMSKTGQQYLKLYQI